MYVSLENPRGKAYYTVIVVPFLQIFYVTSYCKQLVLSHGPNTIIALYLTRLE